MERKQYIELRNTYAGINLLYYYHLINHEKTIPKTIFYMMCNAVGVNYLVTYLDNKYNATIIYYNDNFVKAI